jgi:predicted nucleotidyltransferase
MPAVNLEQLSAYLSSRPDVICAVVFGSAQNGIAKPGSDLDLAVYFTKKPEGEAFIRFLVDAAEAAEFDVIDLVDLGAADPILAFEALSGRFLCRTDPEKTAELTSLVSREYEDTMVRLNSAA